MIPLKAYSRQAGKDNDKMSYSDVLDEMNNEQTEYEKGDVDDYR
jgi:hypothetical protein